MAPIIERIGSGCARNPMRVLIRLTAPLSQLPKHTDLSFDEHQCLAEAVRKGDLTEIKALLAEHIDRTRKAYKTATGLLQKSDH